MSNDKTDDCLICGSTFDYKEMLQHTSDCANENQLSPDVLLKMVNLHRKKRPLSYYGDECGKKLRSVLLEETSRYC